MKTVNIDVGGTFTDCLVVYDDTVVTSKSPTTHYNIYQGVRASMEDASRQLGMSFSDLAGSVDAVRYSTTLGTNLLLERKGPKLGLITTAGFEDTIYIGNCKQWADGLPLAEIRNLAGISRPEPIIPREMTVGIHERVDCMGEELMDVDRQEVLDRVRYLVDMGAMGFVVSLLWSFANPAHERLVRQIIKDEYPEVFLGHMPVILSHEISPKNGEYPRTMTAILNTYIHADMADLLSEMIMELADEGYRKPLLLVHNTGGMATAARTTAINTYNSGPVAGLLGAREMASLYGEDRLLMTDMGGTSFDTGIVVDMEIHFYEMKPVIDRWAVQLPLIETKSIGAGGGSIAWINALGQLEVGPQSAGSMPGPVCYGQGGTRPTVTDADLLLGFLDPEGYFGGELDLDYARAERYTRRAIADPLEMSVTEAAASIRQLVDATMGNYLYKELSLRGYDPSNFTILAVGGAGPTHCCGYCDSLGTRRIITLPGSPVFCAQGVSTLDVSHTYQLSKRIILFDPAFEIYYTDYEEFNSLVEELREMALKDMKAEGVEPSEVEYRLQLEMRFFRQLELVLQESPLLSIETEEDVESIVDAFVSGYKASFGEEAVYPEGGVIVDTFKLIATHRTPKFQYKRRRKGGRSAEKAYKGSRGVYWPGDGGSIDTPLYDYGRLKPGNEIEGPALVEASTTSYAVYPEWSFRIDEYGNGIFERLGG